MATKNQIINMIARIKTIYPYYAKEGNAVLIVETWEALLEDYTDEQVQRAFKQALKTCKMPPTPADVIENIKEVETIYISPDYLWSQFLQVLGKADKWVYQLGFPSDKINAQLQIDILFDSLPEEVKTYLGSRNALVRFAGFDENEMKYERSRFLKEIPAIRKQVKVPMVLAYDERKQIGE